MSEPHSAPVNQRFYVLETLTNLQTAISSDTDTMGQLRKRIGKYLDSDFEKARDAYFQLLQRRKTLVEHLRQAQLCLAELDSSAPVRQVGQLLQDVEQFNLETENYAEFTTTLQDFAAQIPTHQSASVHVIGRLMNQVKMGYYPTDIAHVSHIMRSITFPEGVVTNLLDPCCGEGLALRALADGNNCYTYGVELDEFRAEQAQDQLHRVGVGSFYGAQMSREAFHMIFLNPPYLNVIQEGGSRSRSEKRFLIESIPHLMYGGLMVYIVPYYRLTADICRLFCDNFEQISIHRFIEAEFKKFSQVAVMGLRKRRATVEGQADLLERQAAALDMPCLDRIEAGCYTLPAIEKKIELFKGAQFNIRELAQQLRQSKSIEKLLTTSNSLDARKKQPPLPLGFNQIGLLGGSGDINGLIDGEYPHIIKGRIRKVKKRVEEQFCDGGGRFQYTEERITTTNQMVFNILTPDGFLSLA